MSYEEIMIYQNAIRNKNRTELETLYLIFRRYNLMVCMINDSYDKGEYNDKEYLKRRKQLYLEQINENTYHLVNKNKEELKRIVNAVKTYKGSLTFEKVLAYNYITAFKNIETDKNLIGESYV